MEVDYAEILMCNSLEKNGKYRIVFCSTTNTTPRILGKMLLNFNGSWHLIPLSMGLATTILVGHLLAGRIRPRLPARAHQSDCPRYGRSWFLGGYYCRADRCCNTACHPVTK